MYPGMSPEFPPPFCGSLSHIDLNRDDYCDVCNARWCRYGYDPIGDGSGGHDYSESSCVCKWCHIDNHWSAYPNDDHNCDVCGAQSGCNDNDKDGYCDECLRKWCTLYTYHDNYVDEDHDFYCDICKR